MKHLRIYLYLMPQSPIRGHVDFNGNVYIGAYSDFDISRALCDYEYRYVEVIS